MIFQFLGNSSIDDLVKSRKSKFRPPYIVVCTTQQHFMLCSKFFQRTFYETIIIGSATIDTIVQDASTFHKIGGVATYGGITFRRHGLDATVLSNIAATDTAIFNLYRNYKIRLFNGLTLTTTSILRYAPAVRKERCRL